MQAGKPNYPQPNQGLSVRGCHRVFCVLTAAAELGDLWSSCLRPGRLVGLRPAGSVDLRTVCTAHTAGRTAPHGRRFCRPEQEKIALWRIPAGQYVVRRIPAGQYVVRRIPARAVRGASQVIPLSPALFEIQPP